MAVAYLHEFPGATHEHAKRLAETLEGQGDMPPTGGVFHAEGAMGGGWWVFDVWESQDHARAFYDGRLAPILTGMGLAPSSPRMLDVHWHSNEPQGS